MRKIAALPETTIDTSDIPEAPLGAWAQAEIGRFYRPKKETVTIRLDADVLEHFRRNAAGGTLDAKHERVAAGERRAVRHGRTAVIQM